MNMRFGLAIVGTIMIMTVEVARGQCTVELVRDIGPGPESARAANLTVVGERVFFLSQTSAAGVELWVSDGTEAGTHMVKDLTPGPESSTINRLTCAGELLYFELRKGHADSQLWRSDGTADGTFALTDVAPPSANSTAMLPLAVLNGELYFRIYQQDPPIGCELWKSDGTVIGTGIVRETAPGRASANPHDFVEYNGKLYFTSLSEVGPELFVTDGTFAGTHIVLDYNGGSRGLQPSRKVVAGGLIFFNALTIGQGTELWASDGTAAGTYMVKDINLSGPGPQHGMAAVGDVLLFLANDGVHGSELWRSDGTAEGTTLVKDIRPGPKGSAAADGRLECLGDRLVMVIVDSGADPGRQLWESDGTAEGTVCRADLYTVDDGCVRTIRRFDVLGDALLLNVLVTTRGGDRLREAWLGNLEGMTRIGGRSRRGGVGGARIGETIYLSVFTTEVGYELHKVIVPESGVWGQPPGQGPDSAPVGPSIAELIEQLKVATAESMRAHNRIDMELVLQLSAMGADAVAPLLAAWEQDHGIGPGVCEVFSEMDLEVLPVLLAHYRQGHSRHVQRALEHLLRQCKEDSLPLIRSLLEDEDPQIRLEAAKVLLRITPNGPAENHPLAGVIADILDDPSSDVRVMGPNILGRAYRDMPILVTKLIELQRSHSDPNVRAAAVSQLRALAINRFGIAQGLAAEPMIAAIADAIENDDSEKVRDAAAYAIGELGDRGVDAWPALLACAKKHPQTHAIEQALWRTGLATGILLREAGIEDEQLITLISHLTSNSSRLSKAAKARLIRLGPENLDVLIKAVRLDSRFRYWNRIAPVVGAWGPRILPELEVYATEDSRIIRMTVASACGAMPVEEVPPVLVTLLKDDHELVRTYALEALVALSERASGQLRQAVVPLLFDGLTGESIHNSHWPNALAALVKIGADHPDVVDGLIDLMTESPNERYRSRSARELASLGRGLRADHPDIERIVLALATVAEKDAERDVRRYAIRSLGTLGPRAEPALEMLRRATDDPYQGIADAAREAIQKIQDPDSR